MAKHKQEQPTQKSQILSGSDRGLKRTFVEHIDINEYIPKRRRLDTTIEVNEFQIKENLIVCVNGDNDIIYKETKKSLTTSIDDDDDDHDADNLEATSMKIVHSEDSTDLSSCKDFELNENDYKSKENTNDEVLIGDDYNVITLQDDDDILDLDCDCNFQYYY